MGEQWDYVERSWYKTREGKKVGRRGGDDRNRQRSRRERSRESLPINTIISRSRRPPPPCCEGGVLVRNTSDVIPYLAHSFCNPPFISPCFQSNNNIQFTSISTCNLVVVQQPTPRPFFVLEPQIPSSARRSAQSGARERLS